MYHIFRPALRCFRSRIGRGLDNGAAGFQCLWLLPSIVANSPVGRTLAPGIPPSKRCLRTRSRPCRASQRKEIAEDLDSWKPKVVLVQKCPCDFIYNDHFDMLEWFGRDQDIPQLLVSRYQKQRSISRLLISIGDIPRDSQLKMYPRLGSREEYG